MTSPKFIYAGAVNTAPLLNRLQRLYPGAQCALVHRNPFELLVATILSAQCTDERVNKTTPALFTRYPDAYSMAKARPSQLEKLIFSTGFYRNKAKNIITCSKQLVQQHEGQVPRQMSKLVELAGVGRKTANVILGTAFHIASGVVVDTHVSRVSKRLGLTQAQSPVHIENDLCRVVPKNKWIVFSHWLILHGRGPCKARRPACNTCPLKKLCAYATIAQ